jgi:hypothetical protein
MEDVDANCRGKEAWTVERQCILFLLTKRVKAESIVEVTLGGTERGPTPRLCVTFETRW